MPFSPKINAALVAILFSGALFFGWYNYSDFLEQGRRPPLEAHLLNKIEQEGLPKFLIRDLSGEEISIDKFSGKIVILNFWASWCDPCVAEFPSLMKLLEKFEGKVVLLAISADFEMIDIQNFLKALNIKNKFLYIAWDKDLDIAKKFGTFKLPESYIIGKNGELIRKISGVDDWATNEAFEFFSDLTR